MLLCFFENGRTHRHGAVTSISYTCARGKPGHFPSFGNAAEKIFSRSGNIFRKKLDNTNCNVYDYR
ncbi:hypothetical protein ASJ35_06350 [Ruthenibacterium lactatiformans]|uniref:Uncharacterized protein n=1 Tax=Ruthenibacterium lactatiformans TaxID=1550024 RepID=A0A0W7TSV2_9FIRM|nr:hypothetical protein ASJ35_06350 [Ruthenibacterium lactatiformans]